MKTSPTKIPVAVIVVTKNEETCLEKCLEGLSNFEKVYVVDSQSTDDTLKIARRFPNVETLSFQWNGKYPKKRQWCLENLDIAQEWIFFVDADEEVTPALEKEILKTTASAPDSVGGYFIAFDYYFLGRRLRFGNPSLKLVLLRKGRGTFLEENEILVKTMYDVEGSYQPWVEGKTGVLKARAVHRDTKPLFYFFERHNRYSDMDAYQRLFLQGMRENYPPLRRLLKKISWSVPGVSVLYFIYTYFLRLGFLDGFPGLAFAVARTSHFMQLECKMLELKLCPELIQSHYLKRPALRKTVDRKTATSRRRRS